MKNQFKTISAMCAFAASLFIASCNSSGSKTEAAHEHENSEGNHHEHIYACPMHPDVQGHEGEKCSKCGMDLTMKKIVTEKKNEK